MGKKPTLGEVVELTGPTLGDEVELTIDPPPDPFTQAPPSPQGGGQGLSEPSATQPVQQPVPTGMGGQQPKLSDLYATPLTGGITAPQAPSLQRSVGVETLAPPTTQEPIYALPTEQEEASVDAERGVTSAAIPQGQRFTASDISDAALGTERREAMYTKRLKDVFGMEPQKDRPAKDTYRELTAYYDDQVADLDAQGLQQFMAQTEQSIQGVRGMASAWKQEVDALEQAARGFEQQVASLPPEEANAQIQAFNAEAQRQAGLLEEKRQTIESLEFAMVRDLQMAALRDYDIKKETGSGLGVAALVGPTGVGKMTSGLTSFIIDGMTALMPAEFVGPEVASGEKTRDQAAKEIKRLMLDDIRKGGAEVTRRALGLDTTEEYYQDAAANGPFMAKAMIGLGESIPAMASPYMSGIFFQTTDAIGQELEGEKFDDIPEAEKDLVKVAFGLPAMVLERLGFRNLAKNTAVTKAILTKVLGVLPTNATAGQIQRIVDAETRSYLANFGIRMGGAVAAEAETGGAQTAVDLATREVYNALKGRNVLETPETLIDAAYQIAEGAALEAAGAGALGAPVAISAAVRTGKVTKEMTDRQYEMLEGLLSDENYAGTIALYHDELVKSGKMTPEQKAKVEEDLRVATDLASKIPTDLPTDKRKEAFDLLLEKQALSAKDKNLVKGKIIAIDEKLAALAGVKEEAAPEPTTTTDKEEAPKPKGTPDPKPVEVEWEGEAVAFNAEGSEITVESYAKSIISGNRMDGPEAAQFYRDNKDAIEKELSLRRGFPTSTSTNTPPPQQAAETVDEEMTAKSFAEDIAAGKKLDTPEAIQFYENNKDEIEAELQRMVPPTPNEAPAPRPTPTVEAAPPATTAAAPPTPPEPTGRDAGVGEVGDDVDTNPEKYGFHGGTLADKSDYLRIGYRGEQPFTGHYFYSNKESALDRGDRAGAKGNKQARAVDFSKYNLLRPTTNGYWAIKSGLGLLEDAAKASDPDKIASAISRIAKRDAMVGEQLTGIAGSIPALYQEWADRKEKNFSSGDYAKSATERFETFVLKSLGYEGIDVRGLKEEGGAASPDTGTEGSVIFDIKPDTVIDITPTEKEAKGYADTTEYKRIKEKGKQPKEGDKIGARLNLNIKAQTGESVLSIHSKNYSGEVIDISPSVSIKNAVFNVSESGVKKIQSGSNKYPMASVDGAFTKDAPPSGVAEKLSFDPRKNKSFVTASGKEVVSAEYVTIENGEVTAYGVVLRAPTPNEAPAPRPTPTVEAAPPVPDVPAPAQPERTAEPATKAPTPPEPTGRDAGVGEVAMFNRAAPKGRSQQVRSGDTTIGYTIQDKGDGSTIVHIDSVRTSRSKRGSGSARAAMERFLQQTDEAGVAVVLDSSPLDKTTKDARLIGFYKSLGFQPTGKTVNVAGDPEMMRPAPTPKPPKGETKETPPKVEKPQEEVKPTAPISDKAKADPELDDLLGVKRQDPPKQEGGVDNTTKSRMTDEKAINLLKSIAPGLKIITHKDQPSLSKAYSRNAGRNTQKSETATTKGFYDTARKEIHIGPFASQTTLAHEVMHPLFRAAFAENPEAVKRLYNELLKDPDLAPYVEHGNKPSYKAVGEERVMEEAIVQFMAGVYEGKLDAKFKADKNFLQKVRDFIKDMMAKLGLRKSEVNFSGIENLKQMAGLINEAMRTGATAVTDKAGAKATDIAMQEDANRLVDGWYSRLDDAVAGKGNTQSGDSWMRWAEARAKEGMLSMDEVKWTGLADFLQGKAKVTPQEVRAFLKDNRVKVEIEVIEDGSGKTAKERFSSEELELPGGTNYREVLIKTPARMKKLPEGFVARQKDNGVWKVYDERKGMKDPPVVVYDDATTRERAIELALDELANEPEFGFYHNHYPGIKNILVHLRLNDRIVNVSLTPKQEADIETRKKMEAERDALIPAIREAKRKMDAVYKPMEKQAYDDVMALVKSGEITNMGVAREEIERRQSSVHDIETPESKAWNALQNQWSDINKRMPPEPKRQEKVLFIEELQSDWGQQGKKKGFKTVEVSNKTHEIIQVGNSFAVAKDKNSPILASFMTREQAEEAISSGSIQVQSGTPSAPFVTDTSAWVELGIKQAIRMAAEGGYDRIAWTTGEQQNERYDLSKQVEEIGWKTQQSGGTDSRKAVQITPIDGPIMTLYVGNDGVVQDTEGGSIALNEQIRDGKRLDEIIGKDVADKIMAEDSGNLSGDGLRVGGAGMKGFYDRIMPTTAKKVSKKLGGDGKIGEVDLKIKERKQKFISITESQEHPLPWSLYDPIVGDTVRFRTFNEAQARKSEIKESQAETPGTQQSIDITPEMRAKVGMGVPLMAQGTPKEIAEAFKKKGYTEKTAREYMESAGVDEKTIGEVVGAMQPPKAELKEEPKRPMRGTAKRAIEQYPELAKAFTEDTIYYDRLPMAVTRDEAKALVAELGTADAALAVLDTKNDIAPPTRIMMGRMVLQAYRNEGRIPEAVTFAEKFFTMGTELGQAINAFRDVHEEFSKEMFFEMALRTVKEQRQKQEETHKKRTDKLTKGLKKINKEAAEELTTSQRVRRKTDTASRAEPRATPPPRARYGATNKVFTKDKYADAMRALKGKLMSGPAIPELVVITGYHIEAGSRSFAAVAETLTKQLGNKVLPYLRDAYKKATEQLGVEGSSDAEIDAYMGEAKAKELVTKAQKAIAKGDNAAAAQYVAELQAISKEFDTWGLYREYAAKRLKQMTAKEIQQDITTRDELREFANGLVRNISSQLREEAEAQGKPPTEPKKPKTAVELIGEAYRNPEKYAEVWAEAQEMVRKKFAEDPDALERLDAYFGEFSPKPFSKQIMQRSVKDAMKALDQKISDIIKQHYTVQDAAKRSLIDKLVQDAGLTEPEASDLAREAGKEFDRIVSEKKQALIRSIFSTKEKVVDKKKVKGVEDELITLTNIGAFSDAEVIKAYGDRMGFANLTEQNVRDLEGLADMIQSRPEGRPRFEAIEDMLYYQANLQGISKRDLAQSIWYANMLSGYQTQEVNLLANMARLSLEYTVASTQAIVKGNIKDPLFLAEGVLSTMKKAWLESGATLRTGYSPIRGKVEVPADLERVEFKGLAKIWSMHKYVRRIMVAADVINFELAREMKSYQEAVRIARGDAKLDPSLDVRQRALDILGKNDQTIEAAKMQAQQEYEAEVVEIETTIPAKADRDKALKKAERDRKRRVFELVEKNRPQEVVDEAAWFGAQSTYNHKPEGLLGLVNEGLNYMISRQKNLAYLVPFRNIISNVANDAINYTPWGFARAARGGPVTGYAKRTLSADPETAARQEAQLKADLLTKAIIGQSLMTAAFLLSQSGEDDEEPLVEITSNGYGQWRKNQSLEEVGWQPYSFKVRGSDRWISYQYTPLILAFGLVGHYRDAEKYKKEKIDDAFYSKFATALARNMTTFVDLSFLSTLSSTLKGITESSNDEKVEDLAKSVKRTAKTFVVPNLYTQAFKQYQEIFDVPNKDVRGTLVGDILRDIPVARDGYEDALNGLGEPIVPQTGRFIESVRHEPIWQMFAEKGYALVSPHPNSLTLYDLDLDKERVYTEKERTEFYKLRGQYIKEAVTDSMDDLKEMSREDFAKEMSTITGQATKWAKEDLFLD
jgi:hypothetical protein